VGQVLAWQGPPMALSVDLTPAAVRIRTWPVELARGVLPDSWARWVVCWLSRLPAALAQFLGLVAQVSVSIGLLNALPVYMLDGQHACVQFIRLWLLSGPPPPPPPPLSPQLAGHKEREVEREKFHDWNAVHMRQRRITLALLGTGTALLAVNVSLGFLAALMA